MAEYSRFFPLWGGIASFLGSAWHLHTAAPSGGVFNPDFHRPLRLLGGRVPLRQRVITSGMSTAMENLGGGDTADVDDDAWWRGIEEKIADQTHPDDPPPAPRMTWEFTWTPFSFILRAVVLPIVGALDIAIRRSAPVVYTVVSLVYQSLPVTSITRVARSLRLVRKTRQFRFAAVYTSGWSLRWWCFDCGLNHPFIPRVDPTADENQFRRCYHQLTTEAIPILSVRPDWNRIEPWLATTGAVMSNGAAVRFTSFVSPPHIRRVGRVRDVLGVSGDLPVCTHALRDHTGVAPVAHIPTPTVDGLYHTAPDRVWRKEDQCQGARCTICFKDTIHSWDPSIVRALRHFKMEPVVSRLSTAEAIHFAGVLSVLAKLVWYQQCHLCDTETYALTSVSAGRVGSWEPDPSSHPKIVLVDTSITADRLIRKYPQLAHAQHHVLVVGVTGGQTSLAGWRLLFAASCPIPCRFIILNQSLKYYEALMAHTLVRLDIPWSSGSIAHTYPFYMGGAYVKGGVARGLAIEYALLFSLMGWWYGWDEIVPTMWERLTVIAVTEIGLPEIMAPLVSANFYPMPVVNYRVVDARGEELANFLMDFTRENIALMKALGKEYVNASTITLFHAFSDPRPITSIGILPDLLISPYTELTARSARFRRTSAPGENIISEISNVDGGVIFFTFGSRGDVNPVLAIARYLASIGAKVTVINLNTEAEGRVLASEDPALERARVLLFLRAREYLAQYVGMSVVVPYQLMWFGATTFTLAPPIGMIQGFVASGNAFIAMIFTMLGQFYYPGFRIGAFADSACVPTSADGYKFMEHRLNVGAPRSIGAWWGGDGTPISGWEHVPLIPPGDHQEIFPQYETIVTSGTVGTTALASLCGAKVIVASQTGLLDRGYVNPYDAGQGFIGGQSPDRIFLALSSANPAYLGVWLRANWYNVRELWAWYGPETIAMFVFKITMFYLFAARVHKHTMISVNPLTTLLLMLDGRTTVPISAYARYLALAKICDVMLVVLSKNYYWLIGKFVNWNARMFDSAIGLWVAQRYGWGRGLLTVIALSEVDKLMFWLINWIPITLGAAPVEVDTKGDEFLVVEFVLVYRVIPIVHVAFVAPQAHVRIEGEPVAFGLYSATEKSGGFHSPFTFPTRIKLSEAREWLRRAPALPYGPTWHCYSVLWDLVGSATTRLGVSAVPFGIVIGLSSMLSGAAAISLALFYSTATALPALGGISYRSSGLMSMVARTIRATVTMIEEARGDYSSVLNMWFARLTYLAPLPRYFYAM